MSIIIIIIYLNIVGSNLFFFYYYSFFKLIILFPQYTLLFPRMIKIHVINCVAVSMKFLTFYETTFGNISPPHWVISLPQKDINWEITYILSSPIFSFCQKFEITIFAKNLKNVTFLKHSILRVDIFAKLSCKILTKLSVMHWCSTNAIKINNVQKYVSGLVVV